MENKGYRNIYIFIFNGASSAYKSNLTGLIIKAGIFATIFWYAILLGFQYCDTAFTLDRGASLLGRPACGKNEFILHGMNQCRPLLSCEEIGSHQFKVGEWIGAGFVKNVYHAKWKGYHLALSKLIWWKFGHFRHKFKAALDTYHSLGPSRHLTQLVGTCGDWHVTEMHPFGVAEDIHKVLKKWHFSPKDELAIRFHMCISYVDIIRYLHESPIGTIVMCDSSSLEKTLSQYLVTADFDLVLNDIEDLGYVNRTAGIKMKCGPNHLKGDFIAPEQHWPYGERPYNPDEMPLYDEKTDIYKIPAMCNYFLGNSTQNALFVGQLSEITSRCKSKEPERRPTAKEVLDSYTQIWRKNGFKRHPYSK